MIARLLKWLTPLLVTLALPSVAPAQTQLLRENFEALNLAPLAGQGGWQSDFPNHAFVSSTPVPGFGSRSLVVQPNGFVGGGFPAYAISPTWAPGIARVSFDVVISHFGSDYEFTAFDAGAGLHAIHIRLNNTGLISVRQSVGTALFAFVATQGTWTPGIKTRLTLELDSTQRLRLFQEGAAIFTGFPVTSSSSFAHGISSFRVLGNDPGGNPPTLFLDNLTVERCDLMTSYCPATVNSGGQASQLFASGSTSLATNDLGLYVFSAAPSQTGQFLYGPMAVNVPFGDGFRCVGGGQTGLVRLGSPIVTTPSALPFTSGGNAGIDFNFQVPPMSSGPGQISAGETWHFQFWFRDPVAGGAGFNLSSAVSIPFCP